MHCRIEAVSAADVNELVRLYIAYRVFYREAPEQERADTFIRDRVTQSFAAVTDCGCAVK